MNAWRAKSWGTRCTVSDILFLPIERCACHKHKRVRMVRVERTGGVVLRHVNEMSQPAHLADELPLRFAHRLHRQPRDADEHHLGKALLRLYRIESDRPRQRLDGSDVDAFPGGIGRVGVDLLDHLDDPDHGAFAAGVIEEAAIALLHGAHVIAGGKILDAGPLGAGLARLDLCVPRPRFRLGFEQPVRHMSPFPGFSCSSPPLNSLGFPRNGKMAANPDHAHWRGGTATDRLFILTVAIKGLDGALGVIGGALLLFVKPHTLDEIVAWLTTHELPLLHNRNDFFFNLL